ncbi:MAG: sugar phosphate nucleotidyltransferase [Anaerolineae bacterium]
MKGVILAAGDGSRLNPLTLSCPKPLVPVLGRPLIEYTIKSFVKADIRRLVIVVGYMGEMIEKWLGDGSRFGARVKYAFNPDYHLGNALSLDCAYQQVADEPFILAMCDHMISRDILTALLAWEGTYDTLCVDRLAHAPPQVQDATKVWVSKAGFITGIGKEIEQWNAIDTGVFLFTPIVFTAISNLRRKGKRDCSLTGAVRWLIKRGRQVRACDVSGAFWMDVDTIEDLRYVERLLRTKGNRPRRPKLSKLRYESLFQKESRRNSR